jgi:hypothetical protein
MKTTDYKMRKGFITLVIVALISFVSTSATKGHESPTSGKSTGTVKSAEASVSSNKEAKTETLQEWMANGSYWEAENTISLGTKNSSATVSSELLNELESWMSNGEYWSDSKVQVKKDTTSNLKSIMSNGSYWSNEK